MPPLGLLAIASYVEKSLSSINCEVLDLSRYSPNSAAHYLDHFDWADVLLVGISVMSMDVLSACDIACQVRIHCPNTPLIAGGPHPTLAWREFIGSHSPPFDACVVGEGESATLEIIESIIKGKNWNSIPGVATLQSGIPRLHSHAVLIDPSEWGNPFNAHLVEKHIEEMVFSEPGGRKRRGVCLVTSRSCPLECSFCAIAATGEPYRSTSPELVVEWLSWEMKRKPFEHIYFLDADFLTSKARARSFGSAINQAFPAVTWSVQATVGHILGLKMELAQLHQQGLRAVELGLEAGNDKQLKFFNKRHFGKYATVEQNIEAVHILMNSGIVVGVDYIMFYPDQTLEELVSNIVFFVRSGLIDVFDLEHYQNDLILFPGTPLRELYEHRHNLKFDTDNIPNSDSLYICDDVLKIKTEYRTLFERYVRNRLHLLRVHLLEAAGNAQTDRERAIFRLHEIRLRHLPYIILMELTMAKGIISDALLKTISESLKMAETALDRY